MGQDRTGVRALLIEDSQEDADLILAELKRGGFDVTHQRVDTLEDLKSALGAERWDVIISDFALPGFDGLEALAAVNIRGEETPFIFVSGVLGEERAVAAMRSGARDYFLKDSLVRLPAAVRRELIESAQRRRRIKAEFEAALHVRRYQNIFQTAAVGLFEMDFTGVRAWLTARFGGLAPDEVFRHLLANPSVLDEAAARILISDANQEAIRMLDAERREDFVGPVGRTLAGGSREAMAALVRGVLSGNQIFQREVPIETLKGRHVRWFLTARIPDNESDMSAVVVSVLDLQERIRLEEEVRAAQRMESVGRLAGGVAHDFNNLLMVIGNHVWFLRDSLASLPLAVQDLEVIQEATTHATALTRQLLTFSRPGGSQPIVVNVNNVISGIARILRRLIGADVELVLALSPTVGNTKIDPSQLEQIVMNLAVNARDAMPMGGRLEIATTRETDAWIALAVSDSGTGMDAATRARIFEPFFTTKDSSKGTGLGLATLARIVKQVEGTVEVSSTLGKGSRFVIRLRTTDELPLAKESAAAIALRPRGEETVLVVEDQELVRKTTVRILEGAGFRVLQAARGEEAMQVAETFMDTGLDCLVTDVVMPGMSAVALVQQLSEKFPRMKAIFTSGYPGDVLESHGLSEKTVEYLAKPFTTSALLAKVRDVLDRFPSQ